MNEALRVKIDNARIDWSKYGACFGRTARHPEVVTLTAHQILDFKKRGLLDVLPVDAPWESIHFLLANAGTIIDAQILGTTIDELNVRLGNSYREHGQIFHRYADSFFTDGYRRLLGESETPTHSDGGCAKSCLLVFVLLSIPAFGPSLYGSIRQAIADRAVETSDSPRTSGPIVPASPTPTPLPKQRMEFNWTKREDCALGTVFELTWRSESPGRIRVNGDRSRTFEVAASDTQLVFVTRKTTLELFSKSRTESRYVLLEPNYALTKERERRFPGPPLNDDVDLIALYGATVDFANLSKSSMLQVFLSRALAGADVAKLRLMRNAIPASVGYSFRDARLASEFARRSWYVDRGIDAGGLDHILTSRQKANAMVIRSLEDATKR